MGRPKKTAEKTNGNGTKAKRTRGPSRPSAQIVEKRAHRIGVALAKLTDELSATSWPDPIVADLNGAIDSISSACGKIAALPTDWKPRRRGAVDVGDNVAPKTKHAAEYAWINLPASVLSIDGRMLRLEDAGETIAMVPRAHFELSTVEYSTAPTATADADETFAV